MAVGGRANVRLELHELGGFTTIHPKLGGEPLSRVTCYADDRGLALEQP